MPLHKGPQHPSYATAVVDKVIQLYCQRMFKHPSTLRDSFPLEASAGFSIQLCFRFLRFYSVIL